MLRRAALLTPRRLSARLLSDRVPSANPIAVCETNVGTFKVELFVDQMPITASNFIDLAQLGCTFQPVSILRA